MSKVQLNKKYKSLISSGARYNIISGGRGSGKSFGISIYVLLKTLERDQVILFTRWTMVSARISIIPEFKEAIELLGLDGLFNIKDTEIINIGTGSRIIFRGLKPSSSNQVANLNSISGLTIWILDEAQELIYEDVFDTVDLSVRKLGVENKVMLSFNPSTKKHWLYTKWFLDNGVQEGFNGEKDGVNYIHTTYLDNLKHLNDSFIKTAEDLKRKDLKKYDNIFLGKFADKVEGLVFPDYTLKTFDESLPWELGLDFGFTNSPSALVKCYIDESKGNIYLKQALYDTGIIPSELSSNVKLIAGDRLIVADSASPDLIAELRHKKCNIEPVKKPKITDRIALMKNYNFVVDPSSKDLIQELNHYAYDSNYKGIKDVPRDEYNHLIDALGYYITYRGRVKKVKRYRLR